MIPATSPWILTTFDAEEDTEPSAVARREYCFEGSTGFLQRTRTIKTGASRGANDLLAVYSRDTAGNMTSEQFYGGDTQAIGTGVLCSLTPPSTNQYRIDHTYQYGSLRTARYVDINGNPLSFYSLDRDIDRNTGLPAASRDTAGIQTNLTYDNMARLTWEKPTTGQGTWAEYAYLAASGSTAAKVDLYRRPNSSTTGVLARESYAFDGLGRLAGEFRLLYDGAWNQRLTTYNGMGWKTDVTEWQPLNTATIKKTHYSGFDPFGRSTTITPPDGSTHNVTLTYLGVRQVQRTVKVATTTTSETSAVTTELYDRQGRLYRLTEPSGTGGTPTTTTYAYDIGSRLKQASTPSGSTTQNRYFTYDNRGFLTSEQLPEKGASGNGYVSYSAYDARGHVGRVVDGPNDLTFSTDRGERLALVRETGGSQRTLKSFTFATANGGGDYANGKLRTAVANNYYDPNTPTANFLSQETYTYAGVGGRVSQRSTLAGIVGANQGTFTQGFTWNDLGLPATLTYPQFAGVGPARTVTFGLTNGWLTRVHEGTTNYASSISYHSNGMVNQVVHPNNTTDTYAKDPNDMQRPASVTVRGLLGLMLWTTNTYVYDGSGNVKAMGTDTFTYDPVSRLVTGTINTVAKKQCMAYDAFGNAVRADVIASTGTCLTTPAISIDPATNRMNLPVTYDAAGEQLSWNSGAYAYAWYPTGQMRQFIGGGRSEVHGYTADGERVGTYDSVLNGITYTLRGLDGKVLRVYRESGGVWTWVQDYVYRDGASLATIDSTGTRHFALDHLGTVRLITNASGSQVALHTYMPFGQEGTNAYQDTERMKFTGHERDLRDTTNTTDDLDYMHARYYNPIVARFLTADPAGIRDPKVPQSWNKYAYSHGNPMRYVDPNGRWIAIADGGRQADLKGILLGLMTRPSGLAALQRLANDPIKGVLFREANLSTEDARATGRQVRPGDPITLGLTQRVQPYTSFIFKVTVDLSGAARFHPSDPTGLTTAAHEVKHVTSFFSGASSDEVLREDKPPFAAESWAQAVASEAPSVVSTDEEALRGLRELLDQWLLAGNGQYAAQTEAPRRNP
ncbi:MAG: hypothetical protein B7X11_00465 [Acidobacteria bacterium 37-65-4]|nr:MAG: hypothetical protein B7X11_00465 [Acidobacteria bacterium 37-65-4]